jgi:purine-nucleoside phosphorylase
MKKIALFAAVEEEVLSIKEKVHMTGIGRESATEAMLQFMQQHQDEDFTIMNIGTAGAHSVPVGSLIRVTEVVSGGAQFLNRPMFTDRLPIKTPEAIDGKLFSSDCFVSPRVYSADFLQHLKETADCFDMESSSLFSIAHHYRRPYISFKIVSDHLDVDLATWQQRVHDYSGKLCNFVLKTLDEMGKIEPVEII